jgi:1,2-diacylglycerol 3-beta-galactosyltransferase
VTVLFLFSDTGAGHRRAAEAVVEALNALSPGRYRAVLCDPLSGPAAPRPLRALTRLYGPAVRLAPWAWGAAYYVSNSTPMVALLGRTVFRSAEKLVRAEVAGTGPDVIVSCHPLTGRAAVRARRSGPAGQVPVITVVTDLAATHAAWRSPRADLLAVPSAQVRSECLASRFEPARCVQAGLPVGAAAQAGPLAPAARGALRKRLGIGPGQFVVLLAGGGEGCGSLRRRTLAILRGLDDVHVVTACGRNGRLRRRLARVHGQAGGRLTVLGFCGDFADWLRAADVVVTKAGPGIIAEAACCGTPMLLTSHLPGQERGNTTLVLRADAGRTARGVSAMTRELTRMRADQALLAGLRAGCQRLARPEAAADVAAMIAGLLPEPGRQAVDPQHSRIPDAQEVRA